MTYGSTSFTNWWLRARVVCTPYRTTADEQTPDERDDAIGAADAALQRLTTLLRTSEVADDEGFFALGAVTIGMYRSLDTLRTADERTPTPTV